MIKNTKTLVISFRPTKEQHKKIERLCKSYGLETADLLRKLVAESVFPEQKKVEITALEHLEKNIVKMKNIHVTLMDILKMIMFAYIEAKQRLGEPLGEILTRFKENNERPEKIEFEKTLDIELRNDDYADLLNEITQSDLWLYRVAAQLN